jgi:4-hydroxy-tetrahydrodipicolinate synthase
MSLREKFTGTGIAIVTPFDEGGAIDWKSFTKLVEFWIAGKVEYLVVLGTTGESATVHGEEKQQVFSFVAKTVAGRLPLVAGIGGNDTSEVIAGFRKFDLKDMMLFFRYRHIIISQTRKDFFAIIKH